MVVWAEGFERYKRVPTSTLLGSLSWFRLIRLATGSLYALAIWVRVCPLATVCSVAPGIGFTATGWKAGRGITALLGSFKVWPTSTWLGLLRPFSAIRDLELTR